MYETIPLPNGVRILTERVPYVRSAALGIWVGMLPSRAKRRQRRRPFY